jgi:hypothetical protein
MSEKAIAIGAGQALEFDGSELMAETASRGVKTEMRKGGIVGNRLIRAQYDHSVHTIVIYEDGINSILETPAAEMLGIPNTVESVREALMWHEFFHVLEFTGLGLAGENFKIPGKFLWFSCQKPLYPISEICANAFTMRILKLNYNPFLIDFLLHNENLWKDKGDTNENN